MENLIVKLSENGKPIYTIGRSGIGGEPFGLVGSLIVDEASNLLVVERDFKVFNIYKFSESGTLVSKSVIDNSSVPLNQKETNLIANIISLNLGFVSDEVYITGQFISQTESDLFSSKSEMLFEKVFKYSLRNNAYTKMLLKSKPEFLEVSRFTGSDEVKEIYGEISQITLPMKSFIAVDSNENVYMSRKEILLNDLNSNNMLLYTYNSNGRLERIQKVVYPANISYISEIIYANNGSFFTYFIKNGEIYFASIR